MARSPCSATEVSSEAREKVTDRTAPRLIEALLSCRSESGYPHKIPHEHLQGSRWMAMDLGGRSSRRWIRQLGQFGAESRRFAQILGGHHRSTRLIVVGTEGAEPWHFTAHLAE